MTGEQVRDTTFVIRRRGYDVTEVDDLLRSVAAELDAGRPIEPLVRNVTFRTRWNGYEIAAVDWFLGQFLLRPGAGALAEMGSDPWRDLDAVGGVDPQQGRSPGRAFRWASSAGSSGALRRGVLESVGRVRPAARDVPAIGVGQDSAL